MNIIAINISKGLLTDVRYKSRKIEEFKINYLKANDCLLELNQLFNTFHNHKLFDELNKDIKDIYEKAKDTLKEVKSNNEMFLSSLEDFTYQLMNVDTNFSKVITGDFDKIESNLQNVLEQIQQVEINLRRELSLSDTLNTNLAMLQGHTQSLEEEVNNFKFKEDTKDVVNDFKTIATSNNEQSLVVKKLITNATDMIQKSFTDTINDLKEILKMFEE